MTMTWYASVLWTLGVIGFWVGLWLLGDWISAVCQRRMTATLWRSQPEWTPWVDQPTRRGWRWRK